MSHEIRPQQTKSPQSPPLECPRCGHHLDGNAIAAEAHDEHSGVCTECGLPVVWASLRKDAVSPKWFVESQHSSLGMLRRVIGTLLRCLRPFHFWSSLNLATPFSQRGAIAFLIGIAVMLHCVAVGQRTAFVIPACVERRQWSGSNAWTQNAADLALAIVAPTTGFSGAKLLEFGELEITPKNGLLAWIRTAGRFAVLAVYPMRTQFEFDTSRMPTWMSMQWSQLTPTAPQLMGPAQTPSTIAAIACALLAPLAMLLLPTSLRRARIRPRHFARLLLYSTALVVPILALSFALPHFGAMYGDWILEFVTLYGYPNAGLILIASTAVLVALWMTAAASRYLRLQHALGVGVSCALISSLLIVLLQQWRFVM